jgi:hypothetical protein
VKFLLWQFATYALAAFVLGLAVGHLWWRPRAARILRKLSSQHAHVGALQREIADLHTSAQRDRNIVAAVAPLTDQLSVARSALTLAEAELEASALRHTMLKNQTADLTERAARTEALANDAERAQRDAARTKAALDSTIAEHTSNRAAGDQALAEALARAQSAESALANLRRTHERLVVDSRRELTELTMRAEQAEIARVAAPIASASTVWQSAMADAAAIQTDDQILIVLPSEVDTQLAGVPGSAGGNLTNEVQAGPADGTTSGDSDNSVTRLAKSEQTLPVVVIELRSSE